MGQAEAYGKGAFPTQSEYPVQSSYGGLNSYGGSYGEYENDGTEAGYGSLDSSNGVWMVDAAMELSSLKRMGGEGTASTSDAYDGHDNMVGNGSLSIDKINVDTSTAGGKARSGTPSPTTTTASSTNSSILNR